MDKEKLIRVCPGIALFYDDLVYAAAQHGIDSPLEQAHWLGQMAVESAGFAQIVEGFSYSEERLAVIFPRQFPTADIRRAYARRPAPTANRAYGSEYKKDLGNGPEASGDGYRFRGGGLIQLTGRYNYTKYSKALYGDNRLVDNPDMIRNKKSPQSRRDAAITSALFWKFVGAKGLALSDNAKGVTKLINGGFNHLNERVTWTERFKTALGLNGRISEDGTVNNDEVNGEVTPNTNNPSVRPQISGAGTNDGTGNTQIPVEAGTASTAIYRPSAGGISDYAPPAATISSPASIEFAPWPNRRPDHEPWPRQLLVDQTVNRETDNYRQNVNQNPQYADAGTQDTSGNIGRVEGDVVIERNPFWRR